MRFFVLASTLLIGGCSYSVAESDYPGVYVLSSDSARETIKVVPGGAYEHKLEERGTVIFSKTGYWTNDESGGRNGITFIAFQRALGPEPKFKGYWFVVPEKSWGGKIQLCVDDLTCFEKI